MSTKYKDHEIQVRPAKKEDMKSVARMIQELADFEKMSEGPKITLKELERDGFERSPPLFRCMVAERTGGSGGGGGGARGGVGADSVLGYVLYFPTYSTWEGHSLMMEDLYVRPQERKRGVGERLFNAVAKMAESLGCSRLDFHVLDWNPARAFYESKGALDLSAREHWRLYRLAGPALRRVCAGAREHDT